MNLYGLNKDWDGDTYQALVKSAGRRGGYCTLARRRWASAVCLAWIAKRTDDLESQNRIMQWPGTIVSDDDDAATLLKYRLTPELLRALGESVEDPFGWQGPELPEDLSFLRIDGRPWFVSIAHEGDAFFKLLDHEVESMRDQLGSVRLVKLGEDQLPDEKY